MFFPGDLREKKTKGVNSSVSVESGTTINRVKRGMILDGFSNASVGDVDKFVSLGMIQGLTNKTKRTLTLITSFFQDALSPSFESIEERLDLGMCMCMSEHVSW